MEKGKVIETVKQINWEKIGAYAICVGTLFMFWSSQNEVRKEISDVKERTAKLEVEMKYTQLKDKVEK